jgi:hypothetical protein
LGVAEPFHSPVCFPIVALSCATSPISLARHYDCRYIELIRI